MGENSWGIWGLPGTPVEVGDVGEQRGMRCQGVLAMGQCLCVSRGNGEQGTEGQKSFCLAQKPEAGGSEITTVI